MALPLMSARIEMGLIVPLLVNCIFTWADIWAYLITLPMASLATARTGGVLLPGIGGPGIWWSLAFALSFTFWFAICLVATAFALLGRLGLG